MADPVFTSAGPRLFGLPPGADFGREVVAGLTARLSHHRPEDWAKVTLYVNTSRMQRRIREVLDEGPARLLPRIRLITDLALDPVGADLPPAVAPLRRRLELSQLVAGLLDRQPDLAPRPAVFDLSDSLATLLDEMQGEGVGPEDIAALDVTDLSGHWARSLQFLQIVNQFTGDTVAAPDREARQRQVILRLIERWGETSPDGPVIVAGSTGSRGATFLLLQAVARLPQGAVILPGFDFDQPQSVWDGLGDAMTAEDHPQYRFRRLMQALDLSLADVVPWTTTPPPEPARNRLVSLSLRPAPVTDSWQKEGPFLGDLMQATDRLTLVEAASPRAEAEAIALRLRAAIDEGRVAALISPDRMLTRQVAAALDRWGVVPDDSAGVPLALTPPGRFLRQVAELAGRQVTAAPLLSMLKHPLCHSGGGRNEHLRHTRDWELWLRRRGVPYPAGAHLRDWAARTPNDIGRATWANWVADWLDNLAPGVERPLTDHLTAHLVLAERVAAGPGATGSGGLWDEAAGRAARALCDELQLHADAAGTLSTGDYGALFASVLGRGEVRSPDRGHPQVLIWGTLEARVQAADLVILGGLNEGIWPKAPAPDPWLNRAMRQKAGLLLPERQIGLSAHDYQQAVAAGEVWMTRSIRSDDAETVPSRWVNRLTNLLRGLPAQAGDAALDAMRARGAMWLARAAALTPIPDEAAPAIRPSPRPPVAARPRSLSVTAVSRLIRDPYAIYAEKVLRLSALNPLTPTADALLRGTLLHRVFERFLAPGLDPRSPDARGRLMQTARQVLFEDCPWPTVRQLWLARLDRIADWFIRTEIARQDIARPTLFEVKGNAQINDLDFTLTGTADRIDMSQDGRVIIYDYKTGTPPSDKKQRAFEKQLLLEAAMVSQGAFGALGKAEVLGAVYIGVGNNPVEIGAPLEELPPQLIWAEFRDLIRKWQDPSRGYSSRMAVELTDFAGDFDHLARVGEWDLSTPVTPEDVA